ncbi:MAG: hypothetical protein LBF42_01555 [Puniceicoccales bacterium]|jgi:hypothetical protein|nr:hypothetical protein [Puniceicoccales bacterium]
MKKLAMVATGLLSLGYLGALEVPVLGLDTSIKFATRHIHRGRQQGEAVFAPKAEFGIPAFEGGKVYFGIDTVLGLGKKNDTSVPSTRNETDPYIGISYEVTDLVTLDAGYVHHFYTNTPDESMLVGHEIKNKIEAANGNPDVNPGVYYYKYPTNAKRHSNEIFLGATVDVILSPALYFSYDFDAKEVDIEGRVAYTYDLSQFGAAGAALELGGKIGYDRVGKPWLQNNVESDVLGKKGYFYGGLNADAIYSFNEHSKARAGVEFCGNSSKANWLKGLNTAYNPKGRKAFVWFNASVDCSF